MMLKYPLVAILKKVSESLSERILNAVLGEFGRRYDPIYFQFRTFSIISNRICNFAQILTLLLYKGIITLTNTKPRRFSIC